MKITGLNASEIALKALDVMATHARDAAPLMDGLDAKIEAHRMSKAIDEARRQIRLYHFVYEDVLSAIDKHKEQP